METYLLSRNQYPHQEDKNTPGICQGARLNKVTLFSSGFSSQSQGGANLLIIPIGSHAASFLNVQEEKTIFLCLLDLIISQGHRTIHCVLLLVLHCLGLKGWHSYSPGRFGVFLGTGKEVPTHMPS